MSDAPPASTSSSTAATPVAALGAGGGAGADAGAVAGAGAASSTASSTASSGATRVVGTAQNHWVVDDTVVDVSRTKPLVVPHPITITTSVDKKLRLDVTKAALVVVDSMLFVVVSGCCCVAMLPDQLPTIFLHAVLQCKTCLLVATG